MHAGDTVFGNVGAPDRMDFTVIGSSVNLASRIEGLNKYYGTEILASQRMHALAQGKYVFRSVDHVMPKGAIFDFEIYELLGARVGFDPARLAELARWEDARALYKAQRWAEAKARCDDFQAAPPASDWDGVQRFDAK